MPVISKIRFTNVIYEGGAKRYNDSTFYFDGHNGAIVLENGGGKTVFIQTAIQAVLPHSDVAGRKLKDTLSLENGPAHVAIEWLLAEKPRRRYAVTCVSLFMSATGLDSLRYVYEYSEHDEHRLAKLPFTKETGGGKLRVTEKGEIQEYYHSMQQKYPLVARTFDTITKFQHYIEEQFHIIKSEWDAIVKINSSEGGIEAFFDECKTSSQLVDRLLIPTIEESMEGFRQGAFADLFQVQREGFKQYKELKEKIEENRRILDELNKYVAGYEKLHREQLQYEALRKEAKTYLQVAENARQEQQSEQLRLQERLEEWEREFRNWQKRETSVDIAGERLKAEALQTGLQEAAEEKEQLEEQAAHAARYYYSLEYAEQREKLREAQEKIAYLQQEMAKLAQSQDEEELQQAWELSGRKLRAWYDREEARLSGLLQEVGTELLALNEQRKEAAGERETAARQREEQLLRIREYETQQRMMQDQQSDIARKILSQLSSQTVEQQMPVWLAEQQAQEQQVLEQTKAQQELERRKGELEREGKAAASDQMSFKQELAALQAWQERYEQEHQQVKMLLAQLQPSWERLASVHEKMDSIRDKLADGLERRMRQKQQLLHKERLAFRYVDDYEEQEEFFADPQAARLASQWGNQFSLLETGIQYAAAVTETLDDKPLWAVTLVTTSQEKPLLERKLAESADQLQYPIRVLSTQEVKELISGSGGPNGGGSAEAGEAGAWVEPAHWQSLHDADRFKEWKREIGREAAAAEEKRREKEQELEAWRDAQKLTDAFFRDYPLAAVHEQEHRRAALTDQLKRLEQRLAEVEQALRGLERQKAELVEAQQLLAQRQQHTAYQLEQGHQYMQLSDKLIRLAADLQPVQEAYNKAERLMERFNQRIEALERELKRQEDHRNDYHGKLQRLQEDEWYQEVRSCQPHEAAESYVQLREERRGLKLRRHRIMKERSELERELAHQRDRQEEASRQMERLAAAHDNLDRELELPMQMDAKMKTALTELRTLEQQVQRIREEWGRKDRELSNQEAVVRMLAEQYAKEFDGEQPVRFLEALSHVQQQQADERRQQDEVRKELERLNEAVERRLRETHAVLQEWNRYIRVHKLDDPLLEPSDSGVEMMQEIAYRLKSGSQEIIGRLEQQLGTIEQERRRVSANRQRFREFCQRHVQDVKLREMAERGVEAKDNYAELQEFEAMMGASILKANQIAELRMQTEDQKLQQFITHIQAHLRLIAQELRELPKRTRVRTDSGNKEIYVFQVPDWDEQEGKERIRGHIEWIIGQLEHAKYRDVDGTEQSAAIRKDLDKWLDAKQLLQKVFKQGSTIRISCRKVNNDQQVTGATYSWEESNRWSGGEKWSKNMTLFLGILNYVAEKRQHIHSQMKRHRAVILDNPFGKASSDHVLSPVFYIAEQLGFQMIALTAHVEGKFLQDYFPVVYSCRLRTAAGGGGKQIVDPKQQIQQAYFRDHAPESMDRIGGEVEQMDLF
ncbi:coiled-coil domain-containing protein [Paenibacillus tarimensis]|uniref:chromosome segregation ATPase n=1 Tax=Paenibacillus tarimensis TaxID=416012 RepID=UPI001F2FC829|nr:chromosome segregation ATPase [Paenibacillus tarimensis]MCF2945456.1 chromosome segregation ATPase [Paenibacillus tarimensis]